MIPAQKRGQSLVEFSLVLVVTLFLMFSVVEISRMLLVYVTIVQAARAGTRYASVHGSTRTGVGAAGPSGPAANPGQVIAVVKNFASMGLLSTSRLLITISYPSGTNDPGDPVSVSVVYPYDPFVTYFPMRPRLGTFSETVIAF